MKARRHVKPDPKDVVRDGYDRIALDYEAAGPDEVRSKYLEIALTAMPIGARVLDLGCGTGTLATRALAERYETVGVDISPRSIEIARSLLPHVVFLISDMASIEWPEESFDLVTAFYSLIHLPEGEHATLIRRIAAWLRPGGLLIATIGAGNGGTSSSDDWFGVPMIWSSPDEHETRALIERTGLSLLSADVERVDEGGAVVRHLWLIAQRPDRES